MRSGSRPLTVAAGWAKDPASMPRYSSRASNRPLSDILKFLSPRSADPRRTFDSCACCHGNKRNLFTTFEAGDRYEDHALPFLLSEPLPEFDAQGEFWPDGRPNRFNRPQALTLSGCFARPPVHRLPHERRQLAAADAPPRPHLPAAGARDHGGVRRAQRLLMARVVDDARVVRARAARRWRSTTARPVHT
jgi:hypothetical protein